MNIIVTIKHVPSLADELEINAAGTNLDFDTMDFVLNEWDEQAIEQAVLIKEASGGTVTVVGVDLIGEIDSLLHTALAKGADKAAKIAGDFAPGMDSHTHARLLADAIKDMAPDIILTGVQALDDLDGQIAPLLAAYLDLPYVGVVNNVTTANRVATVRKEYSGGVMAEFEVTLPMVVGVQAASQPPRYAPVSKVRQIAKTATVEEIEADAGDAGAGIAVRGMAKPVAAGHAEMIGGDAKTVAGRIVGILTERGLLSVTQG
jgi:electron transfer flavoprotein beta subunit